MSLREEEAIDGRIINLSKEIMMGKERGNEAKIDFIICQNKIKKISQEK